MNDEKCKHIADNPWGNPCYFCELISRIEKLEKESSEQLAYIEGLTDLSEKLKGHMEKQFKENKLAYDHNHSLQERLEKLESQNKDLEESYMGLAAENRHILQKLEQKESGK